VCLCLLLWVTFDCHLYNRRAAHNGATGDDSHGTGNSSAAVKNVPRDQQPVQEAGGAVADLLCQHGKECQVRLRNAGRHYTLSMHQAQIPYMSVVWPMCQITSSPGS
jgi:hypothetical protein